MGRLIFALLALWASPVLACTVVVHDDSGGSIGVYEQRLADYNARGCMIELSGLIQSSATIYLGAENVCLRNPMSAVFHGPSWQGRPMAPVDFYYWRDRLASHYPEGIRRWFAVVIRDHTTLYTVKRDELIRVGVQPC